VIVTDLCNCLGYIKFKIKTCKESVAGSHVFEL
jgi:hypothetical protein